MPTIKPIETKYGGVYFRSRLEARWACWFDGMGIGWNYEIVGFHIGNVRYLPDFELPSLGLHVEIKPEHLSEREEQRILRLMAEWQSQPTSLCMIRGLPALGSYVVIFSHDSYVDHPDFQWRFADCRRCDGIGYVNDNGDWGEIGNHTCGDHDRMPLEDGERIMLAYHRAMHWKFDHLDTLPAAEFAQFARRAR